MRGINVYIEYILLTIITLSMLSYLYFYYQNNKELFLKLFENKEEELSFEKLNSMINYAIGFYSSSFDFNIKSNGVCRNNFIVFYRNSICYPDTLNISYSGDIIYVNGSYYLYSNSTSLYYSMDPKNPISLEGCYEGRFSYIVLSSLCYGMCIGKCYIKVLKEGKNITIYLS
ncbi:MAG: hypothetical protein BXU00_02910 [Candidatus Nanoclepta minutus]|uniref:Uncharacterized protein n=1 Tax=Candidatus Nanoclepta minutus TaxID=1940235 RepID=A0A397WMX4_9ARCH|nr:MAG: hypothetical protein BXU00_02910 [Candidatus Nanoclepta minutus]